MQRGIHVLVTKPAVKTLAEHAELEAVVRACAGFFVCVCVCACVFVFVCVCVCVFWRLT